MDSHLAEIVPIDLKAERTARKHYLEARLKNLRQMVAFLEAEQDALSPELSRIEDEEADEDERAWNARKRS